MSTENVKNDLNTINVGYDDTEEIHIVVTFEVNGVCSEKVRWGDYITASYGDNYFYYSINEVRDKIRDIRFFRTSEEAKAYLDVIEREFIGHSEYGKLFYVGDGTETCQLLRVSDGDEEVLLDLRLFQSHKDKGERLSVYDATARMPVPLLCIDNGHVTFLRPGCKVCIKEILQQLVCRYSDNPKSIDASDLFYWDYYGDYWNFYFLN